MNIRTSPWLVVAAILCGPAPAKAISLGVSVSDAQFTQDYSWAVGVLTGNNLCTGQFVTTDLILTAAHCITGPAGSTSVLAGNAVISQATTLAVAESIVHPDYDAATIQFDAALLRLANPFSVTPVQIATAAEINSLLFDGNSATIAGWGQTESVPFPDRLRQANTQLNSLVVSGTLFQFAGGPLPCQGDSGGPLLIDGNDSLPRLVGTVSFGGGICSTFGGFAGYTNLSDLQSFISATIAGTTIPLPGALWMFGAALGLLGWLKRNAT